MRQLNSTLALILCVALAAPAPAQVRALSSAVRIGTPVSFAVRPLAAAAASGVVGAPSAMIGLPVPASAAAPATAASAAGPSPVAAASAEKRRSPRSPDGGESASDRKFWDGADERTDGAERSPSAEAVDSNNRPSSDFGESSSGGSSGLLAAAALAAPAARDLHPAVKESIPYMQAGMKVGAVLAASYALNKAARWIIDRFLSKRLDAQQTVAARLIASAVTYGGAAAGSLLVSGASHKVVFGAAGALITFNLREDLANVIEAVVFLVSRPYSIGTRVRIDGQEGTVSDITLTSMTIAKDDGTSMNVRHSSLAFKTVVVLGDYKGARTAALGGSRAQFAGAIDSVWSALDGRFWKAAGAFAAALAAPKLLGLPESGWTATAAQYALAGAGLWLTRRTELAAASAVETLAARNGWRAETKVIVQFAARAAAWLAGGGASLRAVGVSWDSLGAGVETGVGLAAVGVGLATNNFFGSIWESVKAAFFKPFQIGDRIEVGETQGEVEDMTLHHVVLKLDEGRHALVPHAVVRDAVVVTPGKTNP